MARRTIKLAVSALYFFWNRWLLPRKRNRPGTAVVLYYHAVPKKYQARFDAQMKMIARWTRPIALDQLFDLPAETHSVAVTFDDAMESFWTNAVPVLRSAEIPATVFAVADGFSARPAWGDGYYTGDERVMSAEQLCNLPEQISVGSHSLTHPNLVELDAKAACREIALSREKLQSLLRRPVIWFCFPYGAFNDLVVRLCREAGYELVFTTEPTLADSDRGGFMVGRIEADPWDWPIEFWFKIHGAYCWEQRARTLKRRLLGKSSAPAVVHPEGVASGRRLSI
ncbi:MAG TPA: polysaccharide deacetylase family protein [Candidatus Sulfotelmatobacter sp.]|nr:polysaccharide deacetylase family protein [Candidatus Sulfotelmatobacter sp.]